MSKKEKPHMNLVIIGHIDHGKSTLMGHVLIATGAVSDREAREMEKLAKDNDRESWKFAYFMDRLAEERKRGITIDLAFRKFETDSKYFTIIDAPGHADFVKNMITGASQADAAILLMSAKKGEFETGIADNGQTREHAFLAKTLGINQLVVAVNKMDDNSVDFAEDRFEEVKREGTKLLKLVGFKVEQNVQFVPLSALTGDNLAQKSDNLSWWDGPTLVEAINSLKIPEKPTDKDLRLPVQDVYKIKGAGIVPVGRVETGVLKVGMKVSVAPGEFIGEVRTIEMHHEQMKQAEPGDNIGFNVRGLTMKDVKRGYVMGPEGKPCNVVLPSGHMRVHGIVIWHPTSITVGYTPVVHSHTAQIACRFVEIEQSMDAKNNQVLEKNPSFIKKGQAAIFKLSPIKKFPIEGYKDYPEIGRVAIRDMGRTAVVGVVLATKNE